MSAAIAQLVERVYGKDEVTSSNLVRGSIFLFVFSFGKLVVSLFFASILWFFLYCYYSIGIVWLRL